MLSKLKAMPISPGKDLLGRIPGLLAFSAMAVILVFVVGYSCGARFSPTLAGAFQSIGFLIIISLASSGIGMLIGTFINHVHGAIMTGVGISVVSAAVSGVMAPYSSLPGLLQHLARIYPISSANSSIIYLLAGEELAGYDPLSAAQIALTLGISFLFFAAGLVCYSRFCWRKG